MGLLGGVMPGGVLDEPQMINTRCLESTEEIKERVLAALLPHQREFCLDTEHRILGLCAGFGAGKTYSLTVKALLLALDNPNTVGAVFEPTGPMVRDVWQRSFDLALEEFGIEFDFRATPQPEYKLHLPDGTVTILCRALETYNRIRGQNLSFCIADEIDTSSLNIADKAVEMMLARLRGGKKPQLALASTPEGFKTLYKLFVEDFQQAEGNEERLADLKASRRLIRARTLDNPYLPDGFVESLYEHYPPQLIASYIEGQFTNLESSTVYPYFDRDTHWTDQEPLPTERLHIGVDFNVSACFCEVVVRRGDDFHVIAEFFPKDTHHVIKEIKERYSQWIDNDLLQLIPDASARKRSTGAAESDLALLKKAGLRCKEQLSNPEVIDRVNLVNTLFRNERLFVSSSCKHLVRALEQQVYDKYGKPEKNDGEGVRDKSGPVDALGYCVFRLAALRQWGTGPSKRRVW